jgi:hypothetical protein
MTENFHVSLYTSCDLRLTSLWTMKLLISSDLQIQMCVVSQVYEERVHHIRYKSVVTRTTINLCDQSLRDEFTSCPIRGRRCACGGCLRPPRSTPRAKCYQQSPRECNLTDSDSSLGSVKIMFSTPVQNIAKSNKWEIAYFKSFAPLLAADDAHRRKSREEVQLFAH